MAEASTPSETPIISEPSKPGTACLCCRRRKLKCSRETSGCDNCKRADLPCIYPNNDSRVKRKRGPYKKKDKPAREAHLEHVVRYLSDPVSKGDAPGQAPTTFTASPKASEDLVKDALIALTRTSVSDTVALAEPPLDTAPTTRQLLLAWNLFIIRVDPVTKLVLCNEIATRFFAYAEGRSWGLGDSICFAAASSCTHEECTSIFGVSKATLQKHFRSRIQRDIIQNHAVPDLESMQALVLYLVCVCREELESETWALFSLVVRNAQMIDLHKDPTSSHPVQAELRRRLWWTICSLESRCTEEGAERATSLLSTVSVKLPVNVNDQDLYSETTELPRPRHGVTSMSFVLVRWHIMRLSAYIITKQRHARSQRQNEKILQAQLRRELDQVTKMLHEDILQHCHQSRPFDWLILVIADIMLIKCRVLIESPSMKTDPESLSPARRYEQLNLSVKIIRNTYDIMSDPRSTIHMWFFRSYLQWHSLAIVITEIGKSQDPAFIRSAWSALEPFVKMWERIYHRKQHDATWRHVNGLIDKARKVACAKMAENGQIGPPLVNGMPANCTEGILPFGAVAQPTLVDDWPTSFEGGISTPFSLPDDPKLTTLPDDLADGAMLDPLLNMPGYSGSFGVDFDAMNTVFADPNWEYGLEEMQE